MDEVIDREEDSNSMSRQNSKNEGSDTNVSINLKNGFDLAVEYSQSHGFKLISTPK